MKKLLLVVLFTYILNTNVYAKPFGGARNDIKDLNSTLEDFKPVVDKLADGIFCISHIFNDECIRNGGIMSSSSSL